MKRTLTIIASTIVAFLLLGWGVFAIYNSSQSSIQKNDDLVATTIKKLKKLPAYKDVEQKNWDTIAASLSASKSDEEFSENFQWYLKGSLDKYDEESKLNLISYKTLLKKIKAKEDFVVLYAQSECPHCINLKQSGFADYMKKSIKAGKKVYMINLNIEAGPWTNTKLWDKNKDDSKTKSGNVAVPGTPAVASYKDGKFNRGFVSEKSEEVINWLKKIGFEK